MLIALTSPMMCIFIFHIGLFFWIGIASISCILLFNSFSSFSFLWGMYESTWHVMLNVSWYVILCLIFLSIVDVM